MTQNSFLHLEYLAHNENLMMNMKSILLIFSSGDDENLARALQESIDLHAPTSRPEPVPPRHVTTRRRLEI